MSNLFYDLLNDVTPVACVRKKLTATDLTNLTICFVYQWCPEKCFPCEPGTVCRAGRQYECLPGTYSDGTGEQ